MAGEADFLPTNKHESFFQVDTVKPAQTTSSKRQPPV